MLTEYKSNNFHYFFDEQGRIQGEYKVFWNNGQMNRHLFMLDDKWHGEYKQWHENGTLSYHCFFVNDEEVSFDEIPYPKTPEDRMYFTLKYNLPLLPVETTC